MNAAGSQSPETVWRAALAAKVADLYAASPNVLAVMLGGSLARGWADAHSDIELLVFWRTEPAPDSRRLLIANAGGSLDVDWTREAPNDEDLRRRLLQRSGHLSQLWPYEDEEWSEHFFVDGIEIGVSGFLAATVDSSLDDLLERCDPSATKQMLAAAIANGQALSGHDAVARWQERVAHYPEGLARAVVSAELEYDPIWVQRDYAIARDDALVMLQIKQAMMTRMLRMLLGLNRRYLPDPRFKWLNRLAAGLTTAPPGLARRLQALAMDSPANAVAEIQRLMEQSLDLVDEVLPGLPTDFARRWLTFRRLEPRASVRP